MLGDVDVAGKSGGLAPLVSRRNQIECGAKGLSSDDQFLGLRDIVPIP